MTNSQIKVKNRLQPESFEVVVIKDPNLRPFLNVFQITGRNIQQKKFGEIFGIIQINDTSENSAYLPNLLTQILKKEYYKRKNESCGKNFEIALHKMNLALSELAQHEIVKWLNNLNAVIGVICNDEIHFTQVGNGRLLLLKDKKITSIPAENPKNSEYHPMKTFATISAGKVSDKSKLIFTIQETFKTIHEEELERHYKTFNSDEFDNIVSSTLQNEASNTGMVIVNMTNQAGASVEESLEPEPEILDENLNFFGEEKKEIKKPKQKPVEPPEEPEDFRQKPLPEIDPNKSPFENEPEIFLKESEELTEEESLANSKKNFKNLSQELLNKTKNFLKEHKKIPPIKKISFNKVNIEKISEKVGEKIDKKKLDLFKDKIKLAKTAVLKWFNVQWKKIDFIKFKIKVVEFSKNSVVWIKKVFSKLPDAKLLTLKTLSKFKTAPKIMEKVGVETKVVLDEEDKAILETEEKEEISEKLEKTESPSLSSLNYDPGEDFFNKKSKTTIDNHENPKKKKGFFKKMGKKLKKVKKVYKIIISLGLNFWNDKRKRTIFFWVLGLCFLALIITLSFKFLPSKQRISQIVTTGKDNSGQNQKNSDEIPNLRTLIGLNDKIKDSTFYKNDLFLLSEDNHLIKFSIRDNNKTEILLPEDMKNPQYLSTIPSLQLVFIVSEEQVYSYSPVINSFSKNRINIPDNSELIGAGTYLTYIYLLDKNSNQIYRYHRAPGGFGDYEEWFKENVNLDNVTSIDISDSIYLARKDNLIEKYSHNKKVSDFRLEEGFEVDKIRTREASNKIFAFDKEKGRIIELSEDGEKQRTFQDNKLKNALDFSVNFENNQIFVITKNKEIVMFEY